MFPLEERRIHTLDVERLEECLEGISCQLKIAAKQCEHSCHIMTI